MSNYLAIATVTAALSDLLQGGMHDVASAIGAIVTTLRPDGAGLPAVGVNVFLYQVTPNGSLRNEDLPTRRSDGDLVRRPQAALDLHYLLTFYGDDKSLEPQRILGSAVRTLHVHPVLTRTAIRQTLTQHPFLADSNLADAVELVKFTPVPLSIEELSKVWSVCFQTPYSLSVAYQGTVVLIESDESARAALPVRSRNLYVVPFRQPFIEEVRSAAGADVPIVSTSRVAIIGKRLLGDVTEVHLGELTAMTLPADLSDTEIQLVLPAGLRAGVQGLQIVQPRLMGTPPTAHRGVESNLAPFVLHPQIQRRADNTPDITLTAVVASDDVRAADVAVKLDPPVAAPQRAALLMNELNPPDTRTARAYRFDALPRHDPPDPPDSDSLTFPIAGVLTGDYLIRVQIDGAESPLEFDPDPAVLRYIGPKVTIA
jgi:hypothetical protein